MGNKNKDKLRVVIDTNLMISAAIVPNSIPDKIVKAWLNDVFVLLTSREQLDEMQKVSLKAKLQSYTSFSEHASELIETLEFVTETVQPLLNKDLPIHSRDPKDDFIIACALGGNADYIITGDDDLLVLNNDAKLGKLKIITASEFLRLI